MLNKRVTEARKATKTLRLSKWTAWMRKAVHSFI